MHAALAFLQVAVVAATNSKRLVLLLGTVMVCVSAMAQILPQDRVDSMYHSYDGGDIQVHGPSILVRKSVADNVSVAANYYVDSISSASVDVKMLSASRYAEERTQQSASVDYLHDNSMLSYSFISSVENDYQAKTSNFSISQDMFGGLTTVVLGYQYGNNDVMKKTDSAFHETAESRGYRVSLSQVLTKDLLLGGAYEVITDSGFLNNPYRQIRYVSTASNATNGYNFTNEIYPQSRTSNAIGLSLRYFLPYRASISGGYRFYIDSWDIAANTFDVGYVYPFGANWLFEASFRLYSQTRASFYSDLFDNLQTFRARDKELSTFSDQSIGVGATYKLGRDQLFLFEKGSINLSVNYFTFNYDDFRDVPYGQANLLQGGTEPLYQFNATVIRFYVSGWF